MAQGSSLSTLEYSKKGMRQNRILELLSVNSAMSNYDLCGVLKCSEATIRNDLRDLDKAGLIVRTRGGASKAINIPNVPLDNFSVNSRLSSCHEEKKAIVDYLCTSGVLHEGLSIVIDIGSTCYLLAERMCQVDFPINVSVSSLGMAQMLSKNPNIKLTLAGGIYYPLIDAFDTNSALNLFSNMYFDYYFMGANGVSKASGVTCTLQDNENRMPVKRLIASHSRKTVLLCDHTKVNKTYMHGVCSISDLDMIITDDNCSDEERDGFLSLGTNVVFAPTAK